jgi:hypothetical protein
MKFKVRPLALTMILVMALSFLVANFLAVPSLADTANCTSGSCKCKCEGTICGCSGGDGACLCACKSGEFSICVPFIM